MDLLQSVLALGSGVLVGFSLGLIGGGGSILAVPLLLYVVGVTDPHRAIGTSALAVAVNAAVNLWPHARARNVRWPQALLFALCGVAGAYVGSSIGKRFDGARLLTLFALLMIVIALLMQRPRRAVAVEAAPMTAGAALRLAVVGLAAGVLAGFFGIGGGFLIVPGLILASGMATLQAIGSSLVAVGAFGMTTAVNYAASGMVDWPVALLFIAGGTGGGWLGAGLARHLSRGQQTLNRVFGAFVVVVALYMLAHSVGLLHG
ncbi:MAG: hypothetical protein ABS99_03550 [Acetobacteraceae bacterium SCN 69-10]|nr:sulfite exporter TauE/SafE family protein [Rhodospirillales bacterium]ODU59557.1 MAG: hypothetical protein ABS99_03550 [Acetobacteraceae bacterium SCN 69-10]OJY76919.1 MAG: hypothetical protein BGP12_05605 [Rhodospirillales bacterium 70-18]